MVLLLLEELLFVGLTVVFLSLDELLLVGLTVVFLLLEELLSVGFTVEFLLLAVLLFVGFTVVAFLLDPLSGRYTLTALLFTLVFLAERLFELSNVRTDVLLPVVCSNSLAVGPL